MHIRSLVVLLVAVAACGDIQPTEESPGVTARDSTLTLADADVRIVTRDGEFEMILAGTRVLMRLSDQAIAKVRADMGPAEASGDGIGGWIERTVKGKVGQMLTKQMVIPVAAIEDARYEDGEIRLRMRGGTKPIAFFNKTDEGSRSAMAGFERDDAERFIAAVRAAKVRS